MSAQQNPTSSAATSTGVLDIKITFRREGTTTQSILDKIVAALGPDTIKTEANDDTASTTTITDKFAGALPPTMEEAIAEFVDGHADTATGPSAAYLATETTEEERERRGWNEFVAMGRVGFESWHWGWYGCGPREELEGDELLELAYRTGCVPEVYTV